METFISLLIIGLISYLAVKYGFLSTLQVALLLFVLYVVLGTIRELYLIKTGKIDVGERVAEQERIKQKKKQDKERIRQEKRQAKERERVVKEATVIAKTKRNTRSSTSYYVTFEFETKGRIQFRVKLSEYGVLMEGDTGLLTYRSKEIGGSTSYISFKRGVSLLNDN